jgi:ribosomal protein S18 acetylase RimI-like enzyme
MPAMTVGELHIHLRKGLRADLEELIALARETISQRYALFLGKEVVDTYLQSGAVEHYVGENLADCTVLVSDNTIAGYAVAQHDLIDLMMIEIRRQRCGLGTILLHHMEEELFQVHDSLRLESFRENSTANSFYRKNGWLESRVFADEQTGVEKIEFRKSKST